MVELLQQTENILNGIKSSIENATHGKSDEKKLKSLLSDLQDNIENVAFKNLSYLFVDLSDGLCDIRDHSNELKLKKIPSSIEMIHEIRKLLK